ncbi:hypothetical protein ATK23_2711 [Glutamicibacter mysorens]|uniref:Winged helix-turn-helix protein n=1 Tax=Glutamicibacter mysorens TaxID=257984 RepID=A0ABX4N4U1_9MICC|nr:hypothetical protein [Glutamicibacter mysorens]PJJ45439.1 hypothetical protein ATK23_2711 [Glutamicibacter mysorens]
MDESPLPIISDTTGLSVGYRILWRLKYLGLSIFGPAERRVLASPRERIKWDRAMKVMRAHEAAGTLPDEQTLYTVSRMEPRRPQG